VQSRRGGIKLGLDRFSGLYLWGLFIVLFGIWKPRLFLTTSNAHVVASDQAIAAMVALALLVPLVAGVYDLSVGASANLAAIIVAVLATTEHVGIWAAVAIAIGASALIGVINGFIVVKLHVNSFIVTLGMATVIAAVQTIVSGDLQPLPPTSHLWTGLTQHTVGGFEVVVLYLLILAAAVWWVLDRTPVGRYLYAVGGNPDAARLSGVKVGQWTWLSLITSSTLSGIAGVFYCSLSGPSLTFGESLLLPAFAAVFLGSTQIRPGRYNVWGTMLAVFALATGVTGLEFVTGAQWLSDMFNGVALLAAVSFAVWRQQRTAEGRPRSGVDANGSDPDAHIEGMAEVGAQTEP
jgi:ribose transport system permease protein